MMRSIPGILAVFLALTAPLFAQDVSATAAASAVTPAAARDIEQLVAEQLESASIPGLSVAVGWDGAIRYSRGFGLADVELDVPVSPRTRFRTASIAKPMTAVAVMQLVQAGKLDLEADIRTYVPAFGEKPWPVTLRHLLCHQSGIRHYQRDGEASGTKSFLSLTDSVSIFAGDELLFEPGTKYSYSTYAYTLLGCTVERAAGTSFESYMREHVWGPAAMADTVVDHHWEIVPHRASGYMLLTERDRARVPTTLFERLEPGQLVRASLHDTSMKVPGGGILSTSEDLVRFGMAVLDGKLVSEETRERMWTVQQTADGSETRMALGWFRVTAPGATMMGHSGGQAGTTTMLVIDPKSGTVAAVMCNLQSARGVTLLAGSIAQRARS